MSKDHSLSTAVVNLLTNSLRTPKQVAETLGEKEEVVARWFRGEVFPSDRQMSMILRDLEYTSGGKGELHLPRVLSEFWNELKTIEESGDEFCELLLQEGESVSVRFTRFTNDRWVENLVNNIHLIHPSRRGDLIKSLIETFNRFTED